MTRFSWKSGENISCTCNTDLLVVSENPVRLIFPLCRASFYLWRRIRLPIFDHIVSHQKQARLVSHQGSVPEQTPLWWNEVCRSCLWLHVHSHARHVISVYAMSFRYLTLVAIVIVIIILNQYKKKSFEHLKTWNYLHDVCRTPSSTLFLSDSLSVPYFAPRCTGETNFLAAA